MLLLEKADVSTAIMQSSSEHTQHAQNTAVYALVKNAESQSKRRFFSNRAFGWNKGPM